LVKLNAVARPARMMKIRIDRPYLWKWSRIPVWRINKVGPMVEICLGIFIINVRWGEKPKVMPWTNPCPRCSKPTDVARQTQDGEKRCIECDAILFQKASRNKAWLYL
jgi:hypothetical protein